MCFLFTLSVDGEAAITSELLRDCKQRAAIDRHGREGEDRLRRLLTTV